MIKVNRRFDLSPLPARASGIRSSQHAEALAAKRHHLGHEGNAFKFVIGVEGRGYFFDAPYLDPLAGLEIQHPLN
jgi:hypothetical protein